MLPNPLGALLVVNMCGKCRRVKHESIVVDVSQVRLGEVVPVNSDTYQNAGRAGQALCSGLNILRHALIIRISSGKGTDDTRVS